MTAFAHQTEDGTIVRPELLPLRGVLRVDLSPAQARVAADVIAATEAFHRQPMTDKLALDMRLLGGCQGYYPSSAAERDHLRTQRAEVERSLGMADEEIVDPDESVGRTYETLDLSVSKMTCASTRSARSLFVARPLPGLSDSLWTAISRYDEMSRNLVGGLVETLERLGLLRPGYIAERSVAPVSQVRLLRYPPLARGGLNAHTDYELASVCVASSSGLEILAGETWEDLSLTDGQACLMAGDLLEVASGGRVRAAFHRVATANVERSSAIYFAGLDFDRTVAAPTGDPGLIDLDGTVRVGEHLAAMTIRNYRHLQDQIHEGRLHLTSGVPGSNPLRRGNGKDEPLIPARDFSYF